MAFLKVLKEGTLYQETFPRGDHCNIFFLLRKTTQGNFVWLNEKEMLLEGKAPLTGEWHLKEI